MAASYVVLGHAVNVAGVWLRPPVPSGAGFTSGDAIPVASLTGGAAEASVLLGQGNATAVA